jgi:hypothetical protein
VLSCNHDPQGKAPQGTASHAPHVVRVTCVNITCHLGPMERDTETEVKIRSWLWIDSIVHVFPQQVGHQEGISIGVWQGVTMDSSKFQPGAPCPTLLCPAGGPPLKRPPEGLAACTYGNQDGNGRNGNNDTTFENSYQTETFGESQNSTCGWLKDGCHQGTYSSTACQIYKRFKLEN